jgi:hypothetical protein
VGKDLNPGNALEGCALTVELLEAPHIELKLDFENLRPVRLAVPVSNGDRGARRPGVPLQFSSFNLQLKRSG